MYAVRPSVQRELVALDRRYLRGVRPRKMTKRVVRLRKTTNFLVQWFGSPGLKGTFGGLGNFFPLGRPKALGNFRNSSGAGIPLREFSGTEGWFPLKAQGGFQLVPRVRWKAQRGNWRSTQETKGKVPGLDFGANWAQRNFWTQGIFPKVPGIFGDHFSRGPPGNLGSFPFLTSGFSP